MSKQIMSNQRAAVYFFYDKDGIIRDYNLFFIKSLKDVAKKIVVVSNGSLTDKSLDSIKSLGVEILVRENKGFDVWAYKEALEYIKWGKIKNYKELILCNFTCYGPIYPFSEMFNEMDKRECDFWGVAKHPEQKNYLLPNQKGWIYEHIMSYFIVVRHNMFNSPTFKYYWDNIPEIKTKTESTAFHEVVFTKHFEDLGFKSDSFVDLKNYEGRVNNSSIFYANEFLIKDRCPLVKRRAFFFPLYDNILDFSDGHQAKELLEYITNHTDYDQNMIWDDILATQPMSTIMNNLQLNYIVDGNKGKHEVLIDKTLFVFAIRHQFQIESLRKYIERCNINFAYIISFEKEYNYLIKETFLKLKTFGFELIEGISSKSIFEQIKENDVLSLRYETFCIIDLKNMKNPLSISYEDCYSYMCETLLSNKNQVENIISRFNMDRKLGMLIPYPVSFGNYETYGSSLLRYNKDKWPAIYKTLKFTVPYDENLNIIYENCFWGRIDLFNSFVNITSKVSSVFPSFLPLQCQQDGFYCSYVSSSYSIQISLNNALYRKHQIENIIFSKQENNARQGRVLINKIKGNNDIKKEEKVSKIHFKDVKKIIKDYVKQKFKRKKNVKKTSRNIYCRYVGIDNGRVILHLTNNIDNIYLQCGVYKFYPKKELSLSEHRLQDYYKNYNTKGIFIEIPLDKVKNKKISIKHSENEYYSLKWNANLTFSYGCFGLKKEGFYTRLHKGNLYIEDKFHFYKNVLFSGQYSIRKKILFLILKLNPIHKYVLFAENGGAGDNSFELFKYAVQKNKNCYFISSKSVIDGIQDRYIKKHMVVANSWKHVWMFFCSHKWITSYSLLLELFPQKRFLRDIMMYNIPGKWIFVPHGITCDKVSIMVHKYSWQEPDATYCSSYFEKEYFTEKYGYRNVFVHGNPRMDKWYNAKLNDRKILLFFTWRFVMRITKEKSILEKNYISNVKAVVNMIRKSFPQKHIYYVFHHEVVRAKIDDQIRKELGNKNIIYIYLNSTEGINEFNEQFKSSKYLITDYSSVAYDFAYKNGGIPIYYLDSDFIRGHYPLEEKFFDIHLGVLARSLYELKKALKMNTPTVEMKKRKDNFFKYQDNQNCERVYNAIFNQK